MASPFDCIKRVAGAQCWGIGLVCVRQLREIPEQHECKKIGQCIFAPKQPAQPAGGVQATPAPSLADQISALPATFPGKVITHPDNKRWWRSGFEAARDEAAELARTAGVLGTLKEQP